MAISGAVEAIVAAKAIVTVKSQIVTIGSGATIIGVIGYGIYKWIESSGDQTNGDNEKAKKEAKQKGDPSYYKQKFQENHEKYLAILQQYDFTEQIKKQDNLKDIVFIGATSAGKTSLINSLFKTQLPIGLGVTTSKVTLALSNQKRRIWDGVGSDTDFQLFNIQKLLFFHSMDLIFIVYRNSPMTIQYLIKLLCKVKKRRYKVIFVRTACDEWTKEHKKTIDEQLETDYHILEQFGIQKPIILRSSAKGGFDNEKILEYC